MVFAESSADVVHCKYLTVQNTTLFSGFPIDAPDGSETAPSYTFESDTTSGLYTLNDTVGVSVAGTTGMVVGLDGNVALAGGSPDDYGVVTAGQRVIYLHQNVASPTTPSTSGGTLFLNDRILCFMDSRGGVSNITAKTGDVVGPASATPNALAVFDTGSGKLLKEAFIIAGTGGVLQNDTGTVAAPAYSFTTDTDTGVYRPSTGAIAVATDGVAALQVSSTSVTLQNTRRAILPNGSSGVPAIHFQAATDTGVFLTSVGELAVAAAGTVGVAISATLTPAAPNVAFAGDAPSNYGAVTAGEGVVFLHEATTPPATVANSGTGGVLFVSTTTLNYLNAQGNVVALSGRAYASGGTTVNGVVRFDNDGDVVQDTSTVTVDGDGQWATPGRTLADTAYGFSSDPDTGMYSAGAGSVSLVAGGTARLTATATAATFHNTVTTIPDGVAVSPTLAFSAAPTIGMFRSDTNIGLVNGGVAVAVGSLNGNVSLCGPVASDVAVYGGGSNVVFINANTTLPTAGNPTGGGFVYVNSAGTALYFKDTGGITRNLTSYTTVGGGAVTGNALVYFTNADGDAVADRSTILISDAGGITFNDGALLRFVSDTAVGLSGAAGSHLTLTGPSGTPETLVVHSSGQVQCSSLFADTYSFTSDTSTSITASANTLTVNVGAGIPGIVVTSTATSTNVGLGAAPPSTDGENVVYIHPADALPTTGVIGGIVMFVNGTDLNIIDTADTVTTLNRASIINTPASSTTTSPAYWAASDGTLIGSAGAGITFDGTSLTASGFMYDTNLGMFDGGSNRVEFRFGTGGTKSVFVTGNAIEVVGVPLHATTISGVGNESVAGSVYVCNTGAGVDKAWTQQSTPIMSTSAATLTMAATNTIQLVNSTETLDIGLITTNVYGLESSSTGTADPIEFYARNKKVLTADASGVTLSGNNYVMLAGGYFVTDNGTAAAPVYTFSTITSSGIFYDTTTDSIGVTAEGDLSCVLTAGTTSTNVAICVSTIPASYNGGDGVLYIGQNIVPPTANIAGDANSAFYVIDRNLHMDIDPAIPAAKGVANNAATRLGAAFSKSISSGIVTPLYNDGAWTTTNTPFGVSGAATGLFGIGEVNATVMVVVEGSFSGSNTNGFRQLSIVSGPSGGTYTERRKTNCAAAVGVGVTKLTVTYVHRLVSGEETYVFGAIAFQTAGTALDCTFDFQIIRLN